MTHDQFVVPFSFRSQVVMKKSSNDTFFDQKEVLGEKIIIWVKFVNFFYLQRGALWRNGIRWRVQPE